MFGVWFFRISCFFNDEGGAASTPNLEGQLIFGQGFLPLALDKSTSNC
jgi:hypothetical protein